MPEEQATDWGCYRHPFEEAGVKCTRCDRPICPKCMVTAPVGFQCPECVKGAPPVRRYSEIRARGGLSDIPVTAALIAINVAIFLPTMAGGRDLIFDFGLNAFAVSGLGEWYRLVTSGFLHFNVVHLGLNMFIFFQLGQMLEPVTGRVRYALLYFAALLGGSFGALLVSPDALTAGASGAVFGLMAAAAVELRSRGINVMQTSIGSLIVMNLLITFLLGRNISVGGHVGGLLAGAVAGFLVKQTEDTPVVGAVAVGLLGLLLFGAGIAIA